MPGIKWSLRVYFPFICMFPYLYDSVSTSKWHWRAGGPLLSNVSPEGMTDRPFFVCVYLWLTEKLPIEPPNRAAERTSSASRKKCHFIDVFSYAKLTIKKPLLVLLACRSHWRSHFRPTAFYSLFPCKFMVRPSRGVLDLPVRVACSAMCTTPRSISDLLLRKIRLAKTKLQLASW